MALSGWDDSNKVKVRPGDGLVPSAQSSIALPVILDAAAGIDGYDCSALLALLDGKLVVADSSPVHHWTLENFSGSTVYDREGSLDLSLVYQQLVADGVGAYPGGRFASHVAWNSNPAGLVPASAVPFKSISLWARHSTLWGSKEIMVLSGNGHPLIFKASPYTDPGYFWNSGAVWLDSTHKMDDQDWHHLVLVEGSGPNKHYVWLDGVRTTGEIGSALGGIVDHFGRSWTDSGRYPADLDNIQVYDYKLSDAEVAKLYASLQQHKKLAIEIGDSAVEVPVEVSPEFDRTAGSMRIYPQFSTLDQTSEFNLYVDSAHGANSSVTDIAAAPAAPADGDALDLWNLAVADSLWSVGSLVLSALRAICEQFYDLERDKFRMLVDQVYPLTEPRRNQLEQLYSLRLLAMLDQYYGNLPVRRAQLVQLWGAAQTLRTRLEQQYGDSERFRAALTQLYTFNAGLRALVDQPWSVASQPLRVLFDQLYAELDRDLLRAALEELYVLAAGEAVVQVVDVSVTVDDQKISSYHNINDEQDESLYYLTGELQLTDQAEFALCRRLASRVVITVGGVSSHYLVEEPRAARTASGTGYVVPLVSETILLGHAESELAVADEKNWTGMRKALVEELAAPFVVDWRLPNTFLPANTLYTNGRSKIELIREIVRSLGGIVQTSPAGELVCRPEYPQPVNSWNEAAPDVELTDQDDFFQITGQPSSRPGYDRFFLTNDQVSGDDLRLEVEELSSREQQLQITPVPFSEEVVLHHSGGDWVQVVADGVVEATVAEQVEFVEGAGRTSRPVHGDVAIDWRQNDLGPVTAAEDGGLVADIAGNSLAWVEYRTRAVQFRVISDRVENVQVYPEVVA